MTDYRCKECGREISEKTFEKVMEENNDEEPPCKECGGEFVEIGSEDDVEEEEESEEDEENESSEEEESFSCIVCGNEIEEKDAVSWDLDECEDYSDYDLLVICKRCIDKTYPRQIEYKEVIKEIEKPVYVDNSVKESQNEIFERVSGVKSKEPSFLSQKTKFD